MAFVFLFLHTLGLEKSLISPIKNLRYLAAVDFDSFVTGLKLAHFNIGVLLQLAHFSLYKTTLSSIIAPSM